MIHESASTVMHCVPFLQVTLPEGTQPRWGHTITAFNVCPGRTHTTTFGGSPKYEGHLRKSGDDHQKLAGTTVMEFGEWNNVLCVH